MRRLKSRQASTDLAEIRRDCVWLIDRIDEIVKRANADSDDALRSSSGGGASSDHSDPTAAAATTRRVDPAGDAARTFSSELHTAVRAMRKMLQAGQSLLAIPQKQAIEATSYKAKPNASGTCSNPNCGNPVENIGEDRLKEGRCENCYRYRKSHGGNERPRHLCHPEEAIAVSPPERPRWTTDGTGGVKSFAETYGGGK